MIYDKLIIGKAKIDDETGFLTAPVTFSRVGIQEYYGFEIGKNDNKIYSVYRPPEEVFDDDSVKSFINLTVCDDHVDMITIDNIKKYQVGSTSMPQKGDRVLQGVITLTDKDQIEAFKEGKKQVSVGYSVDHEWIDGEFEGEKYQVIQRKIKANHLAIVDRGRCGSACKIHDGEEPNNKGVSMDIIIDGVSYDIGDNAAAFQAFQKYTQKVEAAKLADKAKMAESNDKLTAQKAELDKITAQFDVAKKQILDEDQLEKLVAKRAELVSTASQILSADELPACKTCPNEIKAAVIKKIMPDILLDGKSDAYIDGIYDAALDTARQGKTDGLRDDFGTKKTSIQDIEAQRAKIRDKYLDKTGYTVRKKEK